jgi:hypothetical protein
MVTQKTNQFPIGSFNNAASQHEHIDVTSTFITISSTKESFGRHHICVPFSSGWIDGRYLDTA